MTESITDYYFTKRKRNIVLCDRCLNPYSPRNLGYVTVKQPNGFPRKLEVCKRCLNTINAVVFTPKNV